MTTRTRVIGVVMLLSICSSTAVLAQPSAAQETPPRGGLAIGASLAPALAGGFGFWPAARVSLPLAARVGLDLDAGGMFPRDNGYFSTQAFFSAQFRFLRRARDASGSSRFWIVGPVLITGADLDGDGNVVDSHAAIGAIRIAYGGDRIYANRIRAASEIGVIGGGSSAPTGIYASVTVQWQAHR
jgi:hypothetical protein